MAMITLKEYAIRHGKNPNVVGNKARYGTFKTAKKIGRDWFIDEDEPYEDQRIKSGKFIGFKYGYQYQKRKRLEKEAREQQESQDSGQQQPDRPDPPAGAPENPTE